MLCTIYDKKRTFEWFSKLPPRHMNINVEMENFEINSQNCIISMLTIWLYVFETICHCLIETNFQSTHIFMVTLCAGI